MKILDATLVTRAQRAEIFDYFSGQLGYRVLFIECICDDPIVLERNYKDILRYSADYAGMDPVRAEEDLRLKVAHYIKSYEPMDEKTYPRIRIDTGSMDIETCKVSGHVESNVLGYLGSVTVKPHTLYFSRVGNRLNFILDFRNVRIYDTFLQSKHLKTWLFLIIHNKAHCHVESGNGACNH